jgi:hypothetical protein
VFDLAAITRALDAAPPEAEASLELAAAVLADLWRAAGLAPPADGLWAALVARGTQPAHRAGQLAALARFAAVSPLGAATVDALRARPPGDAGAVFEAWLEGIHPVAPGLLHENPFRREEAVRRWGEAVGGAFLGESADASRRRLEQLDYRRTLAEYEKAEKARLAEAQRRAEALRRAAEQAAAAAAAWRE